MKRQFYVPFFCLFFSRLLCSAQVSLNNMDFELLAPGTVTNNAQVSQWNIAHGLHGGGIDNCNQANCCSNPSAASEIINTTNGYIDPVIGPVYPIYSVFGDDGSDVLAAGAANPQLNFPLKGNRVLRMNNYISPGGFESLTRTISVTNTTSVLQVAFIMSVVGAHLCCESPGFRLSVSSSSCSFLFNAACTGASTMMNIYAAGSGTLTSNLSYSVFTKWRVMRFDLTDYIGQNVALTINASRCIYGAHYGYAYVDASLSSGNFIVNGLSMFGGTVNIPYCKTADIVAPANYNFSYWSGPNGFASSSRSISVNVSGVYTVNLSDGDPCTNATRTLLVNFSPPPAVVSTSASICPGQPSVLSYTGGGVSSYWTHNGATTNSVLVNPLLTTTYTLISTDTSGCSSTALFTQIVKPPPALGLDPHKNFCLGDSVILQASGAVSYSWNADSGPIGNTNPIKIVPPLSPGLIDFTIAGSAANSCTAQILVTTTVWPLPEISFTASPSTSECQGKTIEIRAAGATYYQWRGPRNTLYYGQQFSLTLFGPQMSGYYSLIGTDEKGCSSTSGTQIKVLPLPSGLIYDNSKLQCVPFCTDIVFRADTIGKAKITQTSWSLNNAAFHGSQLCVNAPGEYSLALKLSDANGCEETLTHTLLAFSKPLAAIHFEPQLPVENVDEVRFNENCRGDDLIDFHWSVGGLLLPLNNDQRSFSHLFEEAGTYPVALTVRNAEGCSDTAVTMLTVAPDFAFYIPNVFTPDGDGKNDVFIPVFRGTKVFHLQVFDRWGQLVFSSDQFGKGWDGSFRGSACQQDEYTWILMLTTSAGIENKFKGNVLLYR